MSQINEIQMTSQKVTKKQRKSIEEKSFDPSMESSDIVSALHRRNLFESILEPQIWSKLDWRDLWSASHVSDSWQACIGDETAWQERLFKRARDDRQWRHFLQELLDKLDPESAFQYREQSPTWADHSSKSFDPTKAADVKRLQRSLLSHLENESSPSLQQIFFLTAPIAENFAKFWKAQDKSDAASFRNDLRIMEYSDESSFQSLYHFVDQRRVVLGLHNGVIKCFSDSVESPLEDFQATENINVGISSPVYALASFRQFLIAGTGTGAISFWYFGAENSAGSNSAAGATAPRAGVALTEMPGALTHRPPAPKRVLEVNLDAGPICFLRVRGNLMIASNYCGLVCVWRLEKGITASGIDARKIFDTNVGFYEMGVDVDSDFVATASIDGMRLWDLKTGTQISTPEIKEISFCTKVLFLPGTDFLVFGDDNGLLRLLRKSTMKVVAMFQGKSSAASAASNSNDGNNNNDDGENNVDNDGNNDGNNDDNENVVAAAAANNNDNLVEIELNNRHLHKTVTKLESLEKHYFVASYQDEDHEVFDVEKVIDQCLRRDYQEKREVFDHAILNIKPECSFELDKHTTKECFSRENVFFTTVKRGLGRLYGLRINHSPSSSLPL